MADKPTKTPGSITEPADNDNERISEISNVNRAISNMQKQVDQQLSEMDDNIGSAEAISSVQNSMAKVLQKLSYTVADIGKGFGRIALDTSKAGREAISQYGRAIGQDINYNKQNIVAMALSRSTPIYGYFISKFMETDVWKSATEKMKANIGAALSSVGQRLKGAIGSISFSRKKKDTDSLSKQARSVKVPHMAKGGLVEKAGLAKLHAAEVVMPVDKLLSRLDEQISITKTMVKNVEKGQLHSMAKMNTYVTDLRGFQKTGLVKGFFTALRSVQTQYEEPAQQRMLRALLAIQDALGAQVGNWTQVWQKMLIQHPSFRNAMIVGNILRKTLAAPFAPAYSFFAGRGGYEGHLSSSKQPLEALAENMGLVYTGGMHRLDRVTLYTMATAEATRDLSTYVTGKNYKELEGIKTGRWSFFGGARGLINWMTKWSVKGAGFAAGIGESKEKKAQISEQADILADKLTRKRAVFWENWGFGGQQKRLAGGLGATGEDLTAEGAIVKVFSNQKLLTHIDKRGALPVIDTRQLETTEKLLSITDENWRDEKKLTKKSLAISADNFKENKQANERERRRSIFGFLSGGFGAAKSMLGSVAGWIMPLLMGMGLFGGAGGLGGTVVTWLKEAFLGKGGKGGIVGNMAKRAGNFVKSIKIKFPKGFLKKIGPALLNMSKNLGSIIGGLFRAGGPIVSALGPALAVAAAGVIGWKIGKSIDEFLGISQKFAQKQDEWDKKASDLRSMLEASKKGEVSKSKVGNKEGYESYYKIKATATLGGGDAYNKTLGFTGQRHVAAISAAQEKYMRDNINEYMNYSPETLRKMREEYIKKGGYGAKGWGIDAEYYGRHREADFLKFLKSKGKAMSASEKASAYQKFQEQRGVGKIGQMVDKLPELKDSMVGLYSRTYDVAKQQVSEAVLTTQALKDELELNAAATWKAGKEQAGKIGDAINQNTVVVSNTISNMSNATVNGMNRAGQYVKDQYNDHLIRGDVDGD